MARAIGNPLHIDLATQNGTRPSCAKVKVEVNLLAKFSQRIKRVEEDDETGPDESKWIKIKYDYLSKYCNTCRKQRHNELECWVIHPELHKRYDDKVENQDTGREVVGTAVASTKVLSSGNVLGKPITNNAKQEWIQARKNKY